MFVKETRHILFRHLYSGEPTFSIWQIKNLTMTIFHEFCFIVRGT